MIIAHVRWDEAYYNTVIKSIPLSTLFYYSCAYVQHNYACSYTTDSQSSYKYHNINATIKIPLQTFANMKKIQRLAWILPFVKLQMPKYWKVLQPNTCLLCYSSIKLVTVQYHSIQEEHWTPLQNDSLTSSMHSGENPICLAMFTACSLLIPSV